MRRRRRASPSSASSSIFCQALSASTASLPGVVFSRRREQITCFTLGARCPALSRHMCVERHLYRVELYVSSDTRHNFEVPGSGFRGGRDTRHNYEDCTAHTHCGNLRSRVGSMHCASKLFRSDANARPFASAAGSMACSHALKNAALPCSSESIPPSCNPIHPIRPSRPSGAEGASLLSCCRR